jgi:CRISPR/Cas system CMR subunit Cmr4 (Cas7 group RAMP superfamily)
MCKSEGELMMDEQRLKSIFDQEREKYRYRDKLTIEHVKTLEKQIENLMKDKAVLQDQLDKYIDKEMEAR